MTRGKIFVTYIKKRLTCLTGKKLPLLSKKKRPHRWLRATREFLSPIHAFRWARSSPGREPVAGGRVTDFELNSGVGGAWGGCSWVTPLPSTRLLPVKSCSPAARPPHWSDLPKAQACWQVPDPPLPGSLAQSEASQLDALEISSRGIILGAFPWCSNLVWF